MISLCDTAETLRMFYFIRIGLKITFIAIPIMLIIISIVEWFKCVLNGKEDEIKKAMSMSIKRIIAAIIVFLVPNILTVVFNLIDEDLMPIKACFTNATQENIQNYEKLSPLINKMRELEENPNNYNYERAKSEFDKYKSELSSEAIANYNKIFENAKIKIEESSKITKCKEKGGTYEDGVCTLPPKPETNNSNNGTTNITSYNDYKIISGTQNYASLIDSNSISQDADSRYSDYCLAFAYIHAYSIYTGDTTKRANDALSYTYAYNFTSYTDDNKQNVLNQVYNEIINGRPCILQVNGNTQGTSRHYVTVVGFKNKVSNASSLKEEDLLIIDSWDGNIEAMGNSGSRFMTTGRACNKDYTGYQMFKLK